MSSEGVVHLVVGADEHGVVRHGVEIAQACGHRPIRAGDAAAALDAVAGVAPGDVVHLPFTDRLLGATIETATSALLALAARVDAAGAALSVTLHDVPHDGSALQQRRRAGYARVIDAARGVVVNSLVELALVEDLAGTVHSLRVIPLPVPTSPPRPAVTPGRDVAVLGFVFPDKGYEDVLSALDLLEARGTLPAGTRLVALGRAAAGHEDLPTRYAARAGGRWQATGFVPDAELPDRLAAAGVPVAPNRRVTASASINTWIAAGRRPLVPDSAYSREIAAQRPGAVTLYDADDPSGLAEAIAAALADPTLTFVTPDVTRGPSVDDVAAVYRTHLAACAPPVATATPNGVLVPGNRWDLVPAPERPPSVSVVVPYYDAQHDLDLVLTALGAQTLPPLEVIVADDGSPAPADLSCAGGLPVVALRQDDLGFRAARARNLGANTARGDVLVFLDGDTVPEPGFLEALTRLPATCPDAVTVGRRRHASFDGIAPHELGTLLAGGGPPPLPEPAWLADAYHDSAELLHADRRSYRHVISAVLAVPAALFRAVGGFDERFVGYGGEDWELAHRLWVAGAVLAHVPAAVAWHDGPDWAARGDAQARARQKNAETAALAGLLPDPQHRGPGRWAPYPSVVVTAGSMPDVDALATVRSAAAADCGFWFTEVTGPSRDVVLAQPGVSLGTPPAGVLARAWCRAALRGPADLSELMALAEQAERHGRIDTPALTLRSSRSVTRAARRAEGDEDALADRLFGRRDRSAPAIATVDDLAARLQGLR